jgi:hypothetical protein
VGRDINRSQSLRDAVVLDVVWHDGLHPIAMGTKCAFCATPDKRKMRKLREVFKSSIFYQ